MMRLLIAGTAACAAALLSFTLPATASPQVDIVIAARNLLHTVVDMDKSVAFYRALGLEIGDLGVDGGVFPGKRFVSHAGPSSDLLVKLTGVQGSKFRGMVARIPASGFDLELVEFAGIERQEGRPRIQDPGAITLVLTVRNIDAALEMAKTAGGSVVTAGGTALATGEGKSRAVLVRDPDGYFVELTQPDPLPEASVAGFLNTKTPAIGNVVAGRFARTIEDTDKTLHFYRDALGFSTESGTSSAGSKILAGMMGVPAGSQVRISTAQIPGSAVKWELIEFKNAGGKPLHLKFSDPGKPGFSMYVRDMDAAVKAVKAGGGAVVSLGGGPLQLGNSRNAIMTDPDGFILDMAQITAK